MAVPPLDMSHDLQDKYPNVPASVFKEEGDELLLRCEYTKALNAYTKALALNPDNKECMVRRSRCHLGLGDSNKALIDAESALTEDPTFYKGLYQKAEALYMGGEFEQSLMFYHRGSKIRPNLEAFKLGIRKAEEAIQYSVGDNADIKLTKEGDLTFFDKLLEKPKVKRPPPKLFGLFKKVEVDKVKSTVYHLPDVNAKRGRSTMKQLLGELYGDRLYLENLLKETDTSTKVGAQIMDLANEGLVYLDRKSSFWRQQHPLYSRKQTDLSSAKKRRRPTSVKQPDQVVIREMEKIDQLLDTGRYEESVKKAKRVLSTVENLAEGALRNREDAVASLHCTLGNAYLELGHYKMALEHHKLDCQIGEEHNLSSSKSRALDNIGRCYVRLGEYHKAIDVWLQKLPSARTEVERLWLNHEVGRCYLELGDAKLALDFGEKAMNHVNTVNDGMWEINCVVLIGQAHSKLGDYSMALTTFERALALSTLQGDKSAEAAIRRALHEVNARIVEKIKLEEEKEEEELLAQLQDAEEYRFSICSRGKKSSIKPCSLGGSRRTSFNMTSQMPQYSEYDMDEENFAQGLAELDALSHSGPTHDTMSLM